MKKSLFMAIVLSFSIAIMASPGTALAAHRSSRTPTPTPTTKPTPTPSPTPSTVGYDISWPQCGKAIPNGQSFGIVGVNGGLANTTNSCLAAQLTWAQKSLGNTAQDKTQLYVNTANPGGLNTASWPKSNIDSAGVATTNDYGTCDGSDTQACAWQYGWNRALEDVRDRFVPAATQAGVPLASSGYIWWLDVETSNTWKTGATSFDYQSNTAVLEGMTKYFASINARVGLYSTAYQWGQIVGSAVTPSSNLNGLPNWRPGGANLSTAKQACTAAPLTLKGRVVLSQYIVQSIDNDYSCI